MGHFWLSRFLLHDGPRKDSTGLKKIARADGQRKGPHLAGGSGAPTGLCATPQVPLAFLSSRPRSDLNLGQARPRRRAPSVPPPVPLDCAAMETFDIALRLGAAALAGVALGLNRDLH